MSWNDMTNQDKKFVRCEPDERKELLINSAIQCLIAEGYAGLSVRKITKQAQVSQGLLNHHFGSVYNLIAQSYRYISDKYLTLIKDKIENSPQKSASAKMQLFFDEYISAEVLDPDLLKAWLVFWSLTRDSQEMYQTYSEVNQQTLELLKDLLTDICKEENLSTDNLSFAADSLMALIDGIWVRECLSCSGLPDAEKGQRIAEHWLKGFRNGAFD
ncbi:TetR family transcriptional regulator C-terminal domain-containing protein [Vibrio sp. FJH11]